MEVKAIELNGKIQRIYEFIQSKLPRDISFDIGIILGSGLGELLDDITEQVVIPYKEIPDLPVSTAPGHLGNLVIGRLNGSWVMIMQGRLHIYEGHSPANATILIRVMKLFRIDKLFVTCASGGLNLQFRAGEVMVITDHINFSGQNPLLGENLDNFGARFPIMFDVYTPELVELAKDVALKAKVKLNQGIYAAILGPAYATRAELNFLIDNRCDAIGMSVVHEVMIAAHCGMKVLALAAITDMALPYGGYSHASEDEVISAGKKIQSQIKKIIVGVMGLLQ